MATSAWCAHGWPMPNSSSTTTPAKPSLPARVDALCRVFSPPQLGTQAERVQRVRAIAALIARTMAETPAGPWADAALAQQADQAALLAKADLVTGMVGEFP